MKGNHIVIRTIGKHFNELTNNYDDIETDVKKPHFYFTTSNKKVKVKQ